MFNEVRNNKIKSYFLMFIFLIIIAGLGLLIGAIFGSLIGGLVIAVVCAVIYTIVVFFSGDNMILGLSGAKEAKKVEFPHLFHTVEGLAVSAGIPTPKAYVIEDEAMNAFATGRDPEHASITVTTGLMKKLNRQELEGVVAHEMSHVKNFDIRTMMLAVVLVGVVALLSGILLRSFLFSGGNRSSNNGNAGAILIIIGIALAIFAPIASEMIKLAISRKREYMADANAAILTRYPPGLAGALKKIATDPKPLLKKANKATAHLFIANPFQRVKKGASNWFSTHPPIDERIKRLEAM